MGPCGLLIIPSPVWTQVMRFYYQIRLGNAMTFFRDVTSSLIFKKEIHFQRGFAYFVGLARDHMAHMGPNGPLLTHMGLYR